jgi:hypothetical protein
VRIRRPVLTSFLVAAAIALCFLAYVLATARNVDEKPFMLFYTLVLFPFAWFLIWIFLGAIAWWQDITVEPPSDRPEDSP